MASSDDILNATPTTGYGFTANPSTLQEADSTFPTNAGLSRSPDDQNHDVSPIYPYHSPQHAQALIATAHALVNPRGRGIYATDETTEGIDERLAAAEELETQGSGKAWTEDEKRERRKRWRECLYENMPAEYISGVILFSETLLSFKLAPLLLERGIIPGVRADLSTAPLPSSPLSEPITTGLDDIIPRLHAARLAGARFSKWRAPILCDAHDAPTREALEVQAENLARFAAASQRVGLVPIVEPDVAFEEDAGLGKSLEVHVRAIGLIFEKCLKHGVLIEGTLIKPSFPQPGLKHPSRETITADEIAEATATALVRSLPVGVAGVVFLSGGLPDDTASLYLSRLNALLDVSRTALAATLNTSTSPTAPSDPLETVSSSPNPQHLAFARLPPLSFSFGRGLQGGAMRRWVIGDEAGACAAFRERARACWEAAGGKDRRGLSVDGRQE